MVSRSGSPRGSFGQKNLEGLSRLRAMMAGTPAVNRVTMGQTAAGGALFAYPVISANPHDLLENAGQSASTARA